MGLRTKATPAASRVGRKTPGKSRIRSPSGLAEQPGYNSYNWGGYLIWRGLPVFVDGRADVYGDPCGAQAIGSASRNRMRVPHRDDHARHTGGDECLGARRRLPVVVARLQRYVDGTAARLRSCPA